MFINVLVLHPPWSGLPEVAGPNTTICRGGHQESRVSRPAQASYGVQVLTVLRAAAAAFRSTSQVRQHPAPCQVPHQHYAVLTARR